MKTYLWNNFHEFHIYSSSKYFLHEWPLVCIYHESISNPTNIFWIWLTFCWLVFFHGLFWNTGFVHVFKWSSKSTAYKFQLYFIIKLVLSSKFVLSFLSLLDILYKKALSAIVFLNAMTSVIRKGLITFYFN